MSSDRKPTPPDSRGSHPRQGRSTDLNPRGQLFWTILITAVVGVLALQRATTPPAEPAFFQQTSLGGLPASSLNASPVSMQPDNAAR